MRDHILTLFAVNPGRVRYSEVFLKWTTEDLKQMDQRIRKLMTILKALHPGDGVDRLYVSRKVGNCRCRLGGDRDETINHILSECKKKNKLAPKEYKTRQDWVRKVIYWESWKKLIRTNVTCSTQNLSCKMRRKNSTGILRYKPIT